MDTKTAEGLLAGLPVPVLLVSAGEKVQAANAAARGLFGTDVVGRPCATFLRHPAFLNALEISLRGAAAGEARLTLPGKAAGELQVRAHLAPVADMDGRGGVLVTFEDLTELERAEAMRRDFVANVSHELRTPLTALVGFIETLKGAAKEDPVARDRFLAIMEGEAGRMIRLVNDLLSLSRVEAEERRRPSAPEDVTALLRSVAAALRPQAAAAGVTLTLTGEAGPVTVPADADQLMQVFQNLIENAIKYGASGKDVTVTVVRLDRDAVLRGSAVEIMVSDRGEGIDPLHIPRLTERFYRVDAHRSRDKGGTGLGLAIVKHIVNRHRGRLKIESEPGKGSRFSVILPDV
jgi:two-component system, OmpR family, phosphate regulon sensor histidine kinase PhoR